MGLDWRFLNFDWRPNTQKEDLHRVYKMTRNQNICKEFFSLWVSATKSLELFQVGVVWRSFEWRAKITLFFVYRACSYHFRFFDYFFSLQNVQKRQNWLYYLLKKRLMLILLFSSIEAPYFFCYSVYCSGIIPVILRK